MLSQLLLLREDGIAMTALVRLLGLRILLTVLLQVTIQVVLALEPTIHMKTKCYFF